jgi:radical SAM superfamily enzyme YgiQ (UPF0313 family)
MAEREIASSHANCNVLLVNTPNRRFNESGRLKGEGSLPPLGLGYVATDSSRCADASVGLLDAQYHGLPPQKIAEIILEEAADKQAKVGFNVLTPTFALTMAIAQEVHKRNRQISLNFGGPHATLNPLSILACVPSGTVFVGDGINSFRQIVEGVPREQIEGTVFLDQKKAPVRGGKGLPNVVSDINTFPWIDREFFKNDPFLDEGKKTASVITEFGCKGSCTFCTAPAQYEVMKKGGAKKIRFRHFSDVAAEVRFLHDENGIERIFFADDELFPSPSRAREFIQAWSEQGLVGKVDFTPLFRPDDTVKLANQGLLSDLKKIGLFKASLGIETGNDRGRFFLSDLPSGQIDPKYDPKNVKLAVRSLAAEGIRVKGFFMIGFPGETRAEIMKTIDFIWELRDLGLGEVTVFPVRLYPNTKMMERALRLGYQDSEINSYANPKTDDFVQTKSSNVKDGSIRFGPQMKAQLSEVSPNELVEISQATMQAFN